MCSDWFVLGTADPADGRRVWADRLRAAGLQYNEEEDEWEDAADDEAEEETAAVQGSGGSPSFMPIRIAVCARTSALKCPFR